MSGPGAAVTECGQASVWALYCPHCGKAMRVASEHVYMVVACPHCGGQLDPWRVAGRTEDQTGPPPPRVPAVGYSHRSMVVAGVLGILLGWLGVHRFYLGFAGIGFLQILLTAITFGKAGIWGFIEGILCLTGHMHDVDGRPLRD